MTADEDLAEFDAIRRHQVNQPVGGRGAELRIDDRASENPGAPPKAVPEGVEPGVPPGIIDLDSDCLTWASAGECDVNPEWMAPNCARSCFDQYQVPPFEEDEDLAANMVEVAKQFGAAGDRLQAVVLFGRAEVLHTDSCDAKVGSAQGRFDLLRDLAKQCEMLIRSHSLEEVEHRNFVQTVLPERCQRIPIETEAGLLRFKMNSAVACTEAQAGVGSEALPNQRFEMHMQWFHALTASADLERFVGNRTGSAELYERLAHLVMPRSHPTLWLEAGRRMALYSGNYSRYASHVFTC